MMKMDFQIMANLFNVWAEQGLSIAIGEVFAIDGKCIKSTLTGGNQSCQNFVSVVSVYSHQQGWVVRHQVIENSKKSEIGVVEQLVETLSGRHIVITSDVLHCQKKLLN